MSAAIVIAIFYAFWLLSLCVGVWWTAHKECFLCIFWVVVWGAAGFGGLLSILIGEFLWR